MTATIVGRPQRFFVEALFARALDRALAAGVEVLSVKHQVTLRGFSKPIQIPVVVDRECK